MKLLFKNAFLKVKKSLGRFLSLLFIVALGLGFFAGLRETAPDMLYTANQYYKDSKLMDYKIVSTLGLTDEDVDALNQISELVNIVPSYSKEVIANKETVRVHEISNDINKITLIDGRMPKKQDECLGEVGHYKVGDKIMFDHSYQKDFKKLNCNVVGTITSPLYIATEKGTSQLGNGKISSFLYLPKENFTMPYYTEIYVHMKKSDDLDTYQKDYDNQYHKVLKKIETVISEQVEQRYHTMQEELSYQTQTITTQIKKIDTELSMISNTNPMYQTLIQNKILLESNQKQLIETINHLEKPNYYIFGREDINGYSNFEEDALKVSSIATVFPIFFLLVAAFMCFNTMTRMIEEERTEIGILSALGYSPLKIISSYLCYVFIATTIGIILGFTIGYNLIPNVIYSIYDSNYVLSNLIIKINIPIFIIMIVVTILLMSFVTVLACMKELKCKPSILLRPKSPKSGKKVLLEHIPMIWKHLSFTWKVTIRNMFRYKKRIFMTVLGVAGCTALLLTGLGLKNGIAKIGMLQYQELMKYDTLIVLNHPNEKIESKYIEDYMYVEERVGTFEAKKKKHDVTIVVPKQEEKISDYIVFKDASTKEMLELPDDGVLVSEKMAELLKIGENDMIPIQINGRKISLPVKGVVENYALHYIYMKESVYQKYIDSDISYSFLFTKLSNEKESTIEKDLYQNSAVQSIFFTKDNLKTFDVMIDGLNQIIYLIIGAASLLALIVLYNLTVINMNERLREIATLKVLGFDDKEVSRYIDRETIMLTLIGIIVGLFLGIFLHHYVMITAEMDNMRFIHSITPSSYILAFVMTLLFSIIIEFFTYFKLKKVDMIDSLKSVE